MRWRCDAPLPALGDDPRLAAPVLLGPRAVEPLAAAVAAAGATLLEVRPRQLTLDPGRGLTVRYDATVRTAAGTATDMLVARSGPPVAGALVLARGPDTVSVWRAANDPALPGLASALDPAALGRLLGALGVAAARPRARLRSYRPGRRAVVEVAAGGARVYCKVVPPRRARALHDVHAHLAPHVPVPRSLGVDPSLGVVVLEALPGRTMRAALAAGDPLPPADVLVALLDALPATGTPAPAWDHRRFAGIVSAALPDSAAALTPLLDALDDAEARAAAEPPVPVHGDFHEAQLLVSGTAVTGLLDVDTVGTGRRVDDFATLLGHLSVLATTAPGYAAANGAATRLTAAFDALGDPALLRAATAAVVLGLATGPLRVLERDWPDHTPRARRARAALARARAAGGRGRALHPMSANSSGRHGALSGGCDRRRGPVAGRRSTTWPSEPVGSSPGRSPRWPGSASARRPPRRTAATRAAARPTSS
ncbi:MAG: hypothetical protein KatS3mg009_2578 [Acidimicrobiia bacterium]|nr:MAG: hypothetical protein KatS3mg009_2578 [Acidimicrobiia bacterium]